MAPKDRIQTGIDKLVEIIKDKGSISVSKVAKQLGVSVGLIEEWANFLEDEGLVEMEYRLTGAFIVGKKYSEKDVKKQEKELKNRKDVFIKNVHSTVSKLDSSILEDVKKHFGSLSKQIDIEYEHIKDDVAYLKHLEELHKNLDKDILEQEEEFNSKFKDTNSMLIQEEKRYQHLLLESDKEHSILRKDNDNIQRIKQEEDIILNRLRNLEKAEMVLRKSIIEKNDEIDRHQFRIKNLKKVAENLKLDIYNHKSSLKMILEEKKKREKTIEKVSKSIVSKVIKKKKEIRSGVKKMEGVLGDFQHFMTKKKRIQNILHDTDINTKKLKKEMDVLLKDIRKLNIISKSLNAAVFSKEIKKQFEKLEKKKDKVHKDYHAVSSILKLRKKR